MSRCILVMGTGRSRTSAVAGILHELGCNMGADHIGAGRSNPYGTYEDKELFLLGQDYVENKVNSEVFRPILAERSKQELWGYKDPELVVTASFVIPMLRELGVDVRVVVCRRDPRDVVNSYIKAYKRGRIMSEAWYARASADLSARLAEFNGPVLEIDTEDLLDNPEKYTRELMDFVFDEAVPPENFNAARLHVKREPKRETRGWGKIAAGVRIYKHPEPEFFSSWTLLLTGGLRDYDMVLMPQYYQPAHWSATALARAFLQTNKDSLLLVDDDMNFEGDALHRLREHRANWDYDIIMAFCTRRSWPPEPIIFKVAEPQPEPRCLDGESYNIDIDFKWGEVVNQDVVGLAFTLIKRHVFEAMIDEDWGLDYSYFFTYGQGLESDDVPFCRRARELGFRIGLDTSVWIEHVGRHLYGKHDFDIWAKQKLEGAKTHLDMETRDLTEILRKAARGEDRTAKQANLILGEILNA